MKDWQDIQDPARLLSLRQHGAKTPLFMSSDHLNFIQSGAIYGQSMERQMCKLMQTSTDFQTAEEEKTATSHPYHPHSCS